MIGNRRTLRKTALHQHLSYFSHTFFLTFSATSSISMITSDTFSFSSTHSSKWNFTEIGCAIKKSISSQPRGFSRILHRIYISFERWQITERVCAFCKGDRTLILSFETEYLPATSLWLNKFRIETLSMFPAFPCRRHKRLRRICYLVNRCLISKSKNLAPMT
jgi:hypothetical protein